MVSKGRKALIKSPKWEKIYADGRRGWYDGESNRRAKGPLFKSILEEHKVKKPPWSSSFRASSLLNPLPMRVRRCLQVQSGGGRLAGADERKSARCKCRPERTGHMEKAKMVTMISGSFGRIREQCRKAPRR